MRILFIDLLSPVGHKDINKFTFNILKEFDYIDLVDLAVKNNYLKNIYNKAREVYKIPDKYFRYGNKFDFRVKNIQKIYWIFKNINIDSYDIVFISSYETISFSLMWRKQISPRTLIFNHNNIDELDSIIKKFFLKNINSNVEHIVYEEYIKKYLESIRINNKKWIIPHPIDFSKKRDIQQPLSNNKNKFLVFAPSGSNDDRLINNLIYHSKRKEILNKNIKLIIKSQNINFKDEQLIVSNKRLSYEDYIKNFYKSDFIALFFDKSFKYRISGVFFDSLAFRKNILFSNNLFAKYYLNKHPNLGKKFDDIDEFLKILNKYYLDNLNINDEAKQNNFKSIHKEYSKKKIKQDIDAMLKIK